MKSNFEKYLHTLQPKVTNIYDLIDVNKIFDNMREVESDLNTLNYLICNNENEFNKRVDFLFDKNKDCFKTLFLLLAIRYEKNLEFSLNNNVYKIEEILVDKRIIKNVFQESGLIDFIIKGKIKNFVDYAYGVEVGMDTNARKNRNGSNVEKKLYDSLIVMFQEYNFITISEQQKIKEFNGKQFDIVIENRNSKKKILIESSFYNSGGSKINETARSYYDLFNKINQYANKYTFIWLADGYGMTTIKKTLRTYYDNGYIFNHELFYKEIEKIVLNN